MTDEEKKARRKASYARYIVSEKGKAARKATIDRYPHKIKARNVARGAKRRGKIVPKPCVDCGALKVQAHHEDYSKPLDVVWLCVKCHAIRHRA